MPGIFISLDGIDGCGKSTQCRLLADWLRSQGHTVTTCRDPGGTALGDEIRQLLLSKNQEREPLAEALLFMASRVQLLSEIIDPALERGEIVISDRYLLSTVAYQGYGKGVDRELLWAMGRWAADNREPDLTLVLDLPVEAAEARLQRPADNMERLGRDFFQRVRDGFLREARLNPHKIHVIDAAQPIEDVHAQIVKEVSRVLEAHSGA
jgi:dTMP kinase